jgi:hypothetical protein
MKVLNQGGQDATRWQQERPGPRLLPKVCESSLVSGLSLLNHRIGCFWRSSLNHERSSPAPLKLCQDFVPDFLAPLEGAMLRKELRAR